MTLSVKDVVVRIMSFAHAQAGVKSISDMHLPIVYVLYCLHKNFAHNTFPLNFTPESKNDKLYNDLSEAARTYLSGFRLDDLHTFCHGLCFGNREFFDNNYVSILLELNKAISLNSGKEEGLFFTPVEISSLIAYFIDKEGCKSIFDPFCGTANIIHYLQTIEGNICFEGQDINPNITLLARVFVEACKGVDIGIKCTNSINDWNEKHFDAVCSCPPFGLKFPNSNGLKEEFQQSRVILEDIVYGRAFRNNSANVVVLLEPLGFAFRDGNEKNLRKYLVENNFLDTVISLPSNLLYSTSIVSVLMVCKRNRQDGQPITLVDASKTYVKNGREIILDTETIIGLVQHPESENCVLVNTNEIREHDYVLTPSTYIVRELEEFPEGYQITVLKDLVESISQNKMYSETKGRLVTISQLSTDATDYKRLPESFEMSSDLKKASKLEEPALLLSTIGVLKPTFCPASPEYPVFLHPHVRAFRLKEDWVNPAYLCLQLSKSKGYIVGAFVPHINLSEILRIKVAFPSIGTQQSFDEQGRLYNEAVDSAKLAKANELGLLEVIDKMKADYINVVRMRKHDMMPYVRELGSFERTIRHYVSKRDDMSDFSEKMNSLLDRYKDNLARLSELINIFSEEQQFGEPEQFNLNKYLVELEISHDESKGYWIEYDRDDNALAEYGIPVSLGVYSDTFEPVAPDSKWGKELIEEESKFPVIVEINHLDFERLVRNIIENAITHGFTDPNRKDYGIGIDLTVDMEREMFQIDFSNNGTPLPSGMDKQRYGLLGEKAGITGRTGRGGYIVKSIVEHYKGDYDVFMNGSNTVVRILLPIAHYDYEDEYDI